MAKAMQIVPFEQAPVPAYLQAALDGKKNDDLYHAGGLPGLSFRGKVWRYSIKGEEVDVVNGDGDPQATIEIVLLKANPRPSKRYYPGKYVEGSSDAPACRSIDGQKPDVDIAEPVSANCAACPMNVMGSRITEDGKKAKACADNRRIAVIPADFSQEIPPLLLTLPPTSVWDKDNAVNEAKGWFALAQYGDFLNKKGAHYQAVVTRVGFDARKSFPKLLFKTVRWLTEDEFAKVQGLAESDAVQELLTNTGAAPAPIPAPAAPAPAAPPAPEAEEAPPAPAAAKAPARRAVKPAVDDTPPAGGDDAPPGAAPAAPKTTKPRAPVVVAASDSDLDAELEAALKGMDD